MIVQTQGLKHFQELRAEEKKRAKLVAEIKANNPKLTHTQAQCIADGALKSQELRAKHKQGGPHKNTHKKAHNKSHNKSHKKPSINNALAVQLKALNK